ncbi:hypothetical protein TD95_000685 [Thielaviopsis punctulata]|uniref:Transcription factor domain-containing protein n=1 Tax=Thielaviopsis punctulata TaxID=72032 RepID=A0A0F4ZID0_9PEZI|nr:hypothetical protein TD95_000685 [Thielaviopsis punctulata]
MSNYYQHFLMSMSGGQAPMHPVDINGIPIPGIPSVGGPVAPIPMAPNSITLPHSPAPYFQSAVASETPGYTAPTAQRWRRRFTGMEPVKHKRTRSGCFTCRSRRVKDKDPKSKGASKAPKAAKSKEKSPAQSIEYDDEEPPAESPKVKLETIIDEDEPADSSPAVSASYKQSTPSTSVSVSAAASQDTSSPSASRPPISASSPDYNAETGKYSTSASPAASTSASSSTGTELTSTAQSSLLDYSHLTSEMQDCIHWFHQNITHYHYGVISDPDDFFSLTLPNLALYDDGLLYAVIGFSNYLRTMESPNGDMENFLVPFNSSVTLLLNAMRQGTKPTVVMLATILQLATMEEYLGDWISVMGHQVAAKELITQLYTVDNMMETSIGRVLLAWYSRFDCFVGIMGRFATALPQEWFTRYVEDMAHRTAADPLNVLVLQEEGASHLRICSEEIARLNYKISNNLMMPQDYFVEHGRISALMKRYFDGMNSLLLDPTYAIDFAEENIEPDPYGVVNLHDPQVRLFKAPLFGVNVLRAEFHSIFIMHSFQQAISDRTGPVFKECQRHAYAICTIFEGIEKYTQAPRGALLLVQSCLGLAAMFFPPDQNHRNWLRRKFALIESIGYIQSVNFRSNMTKFFDDPTTLRWWLPDDGGYTPILDKVRSFTDERNLVAKQWQEELRDVSHIFKSLDISNP